MIHAITLAALLAAAPVAAEAEPPLKVGEFAPSFLLKTINKELSGIEVFSTKTYVGATAPDKKQALLLNFAASYCGPCKKELPELSKLGAEYAERGVMFAVVVIDKEAEGIEAMRKFVVDDLALTAPVLSDRLAIVGRRYKADHLPLSVLVGSEGRVHWLRSGYEADTLAAIKAELDKVAAPLPEPPESPAKKGKKKKKKKKKKGKSAADGSGGPTAVPGGLTR
jgi:thiol-disulfide isomerase/thioredoxin